MLTDKYQRKLDYLRVSITDKCNLRCVYCMPAEGVELLPHDEILRNEEFVHFIRVFAGLGIKKVRFTGGEPLVRKGFIDIAAGTRELFPEIEIGLTTNGVLLDTVLDDLRRLNIMKLNISLDTVSPEEYKKITGRDYFSRVAGNIEKAIGYDFFNIKINSVLSHDTLSSLDGLLDFFKEGRAALRFIERMPFPENAGSEPSMVCDNLIEALKERGTLIRNERKDTVVALMFDYHYKNRYRMNIGIIPSMTHNICARCNRLRLTCDGFLKTCLHSSVEYDLKSPYRMDMGDEALKDIILKAVAEKPKSHNLNHPQQSPGGCSALPRKRGMYRIGG